MKIHKICAWVATLRSTVPLTCGKFMDEKWGCHLQSEHEPQHLINAGLIQKFWLPSL